ncbi:hypothetical protein [Paracidobacterium acidisoli]|uniref:Uncharacterized protein n=1 Tax=Paracidobacterium acidisoli TaxID=2303751 RepID=A0A372INP4_9BACT|nr:hypothetical protein [Paracidobacterium acidisoli]MBT9332046.1 hypothetical protein [Paracidobacterium acidisoli]
MVDLQLSQQIIRVVRKLLNLLRVQDCGACSAFVLVSCIPIYLYILLYGCDRQLNVDMDGTSNMAASPSHSFCKAVMRL